DQKAFALRKAPSPEPVMPGLFSGCSSKTSLLQKPRLYNVEADQQEPHQKYRKGEASLCIQDPPSVLAKRVLRHLSILQPEPSRPRVECLDEEKHIPSLKRRNHLATKCSKAVLTGSP